MSTSLQLIIVTATMFIPTTSQSINCANPVDIMFLLDGSSNISQREWNYERNFVARIIHVLDISLSTANVGFTVYSSNIDHHTGLTPFRSKQALREIAKTLHHPSGIATNTTAAIKQVHDEFRNQPSSRSNAPKLMILFTDGSLENPVETIRQAQLAKADGITIIPVGVGNNVVSKNIQSIATNPRKLYHAPDLFAVRGILSDIRNIICRDNITTVSPIVTLITQTQPTVSVDKLCNNPADIVFLLDGSDSISDADFIRLKTFVTKLIDNFEIRPDGIRVGIIVYSTLVGEKVGLFPPPTKIMLKALANNLEHPKFGTNTAAGIQAAHEMISQQGRPDVPKLVVVITDGRSTHPNNTIVKSRNAKTQGITIMTVGVGQDVFSGELGQIASSPKYVTKIADFIALANSVYVTRDLICASITTTTLNMTTTLSPTHIPGRRSTL